MAFVKLEKKTTEYAGESFSKPLAKGDGSVWEATDSGYYQLVDSEGAIISTAPMTKSANEKALIFFVPKSDTIGITGKYKVVARLTNTLNAELDDVIAEYSIIYSILKA